MEVFVLFTVMMGAIFLYAGAWAGYQLLKDCFILVSEFYRASKRRSYADDGLDNVYYLADLQSRRDASSLQEFRR